MTENGVSLLASQFDSTVGIFWERMEGLIDTEYLWEPVPDSWSLRPRDRLRGKRGLGKGEFLLDFGPESKPAPMRTIAWHVAPGHRMPAAFGVDHRRPRAGRP